MGSRLTLLRLDRFVCDSADPRLQRDDLRGQLALISTQYLRRLERKVAAELQRVPFATA